MKKIFFLFILIFSFNSNVFAYTFNGVEVPEKSSIDDNFFGVDTVVSILDKLSITYDDNSKIVYTYYINQAFNDILSGDSSVKAINIIFCIVNGYSSEFYMIASNGTFSDTLNYSFFNFRARRVYTFNGWTYDSSNNINGYNYTNPIQNCYKITQNSFSHVKSGSYVTSSFADVVVSNGNSISTNILSPIESFTVAGLTDYGYAYYFLTNTYEFSEIKEPPSSSGDNGSGESGGTDLTMTNELIAQIDNQIKELNSKMPTSGDIQSIISGETDKIISIFSGDTSNIDSGDSSILTDNKYQIDDPTDNILTGIFQQIADVMMTVDDSPIQTEFMGKQIELRPDYWKIPDGPLKALFIAYFSYWVGKTIILDIRKTINKFKEGNFEQIATEDITANMV